MSTLRFVSTRGQGHSLTVDQDSHHILIISDIFSRATRIIVIILHVESPGAEGERSRSHDQHVWHAHTWLKPSKIMISRSNGLMALKVDMEHPVLKYY